MWPYLYLLSNGFGRIEFDLDAVAFKFASFATAAPSPSELGAFFEEYQLQHLILLYEADGQTWGQWDTRRSHLKKFKTVKDTESPAPPEPLYSNWLREQHRSDWPAYHWSEAVQSGGEDPDEGPLTQGFPKSSERVTQHLLKPAPTLPQDFGLGVGVGSGIGEGAGKGIGDGKIVAPNATLDFSELAPDDLPLPALAAHLIEFLGIPTNPPLLMAVAESIRAKAHAEKTTPASAHNFILLRAALAKKQGQSKTWLFWFRDADYDRHTKEETRDDWLARHP
jgi:hypothetical protein